MIHLLPSAEPSEVKTEWMTKLSGLMSTAAWRFMKLIETVCLLVFITEVLFHLENV